MRCTDAYSILRTMVDRDSTVTADATSCRQALQVALLFLCLCGGGVAWGQDESADLEPGREDADETSLETRVADLRDTINENLVRPLVPDAEPDAEAPAEDAAPVEPPEAAVPEDEEEPWYGKFQSVTGFLQSMPDRTPFLKDKGWLHFGRVEVEYGEFTGGILEDESGFNFRSLRAGIIRQFSEITTVKLEVDLTDGDSNWTDLYGRFRTRFGVFTVGNQQIAQTLVNQTSRLAHTFFEDPLPADAFGLGRRLGGGWDFHLNKVGAHLTAFGRDLNDDIGKFGYGARFYYNPTRTPFSLFHVGISGVREEMDRDARFRAWPETRVGDTRLVDTGENPNVDEQSIFGLEIAGARDSLSVQSEFFIAEWKRPDGSDPRFTGYYVQASWAVTGETFQYDQGKFLKLRTNNPRGAWEVGLRYSTVDLNDLDVTGGEQDNVSLAVNWYAPGNQFRVQSGWIRYNTDKNAGNQDSNIVQIRAQYHW